MGKIPTTLERDAKTDVLAWAIARRYLSDSSMAELHEPCDTNPDQPAIAG